MTGAGRFAGVVIVAAGRGERFGDSDKVLADAAGKPLLCWSVEAALAASLVTEIVVVGGTHSRDKIDDLLRQRYPGEPIAACLGGERRQDSVMAGIARLQATVEVAIIHDAARPLATPELFDTAGTAAVEHGAAIAAVPVTDTIKEVDGNLIVRTVDRKSLWAAQTPQAFRLSLLKEVFATAITRHREFTDEAELLESLGYPVNIVEGARTNLKVTVPDDLEMADFLLTRRIERDSHVST